MAGTNKNLGVPPETLPVAPAIILVNPQLGENIGMVSRAMLNCGMTDLRLVAPRDGWPNDQAIAASAGARLVIENAKLFETTADAIADLTFVLATTARNRDMISTIYNPDSAGAEIISRNAGLNKDDATKCGIMFGPERAGLVNEDIALSNGILNVPLNPGFSSLNLAQAVLLMSYSWYSKAIATSDDTDTIIRTGDTDFATRAEINHMLKRLENALDDVNFFASPDIRPNTVRNITNMFSRSDITTQEIQTLQGIISAFQGKKLSKTVG